VRVCRVDASAMVWQKCGEFVVAYLATTALLPSCELVINTFSLHQMNGRGLGKTYDVCMRRRARARQRSSSCESLGALWYR